MAVGDESEEVKDEVCAINLYIEAANCGRRCSPESKVTFYVFGGASDDISGGELTGIIGSLGSYLDGFIGLGICAYIYFFYSTKLAMTDDFFSFGLWWVAGFAAIYMFGSIAGFVGLGLDVIYDWLCAFLFTLAFPLWI